MSTGTEELLHQLAPDMRLRAPLRSTGKSVLAEGTYDNQPAIAKHLVDTAPLWAAHFAREAAALHTFTHTPPPIGAPRLLAAWPEKFLIIMERLPGTVFSTQRHPPAPLNPLLRDGLLDQLQALSDWTGACGDPWNQSQDYTERINKYTHTHQILSIEDAYHLTRALDGLTDNFRPAHGDLIAANVLVSQDVLRLVDWEYAGSYLRGYDHALLWVTATRDVATRAAIKERLTTSRKGHQAFLVNTLLLLAREIRIHLPHHHEPWAASRLEQLHQDLSQLSKELRRR